MKSEALSVGRVQPRNWLTAGLVLGLMCAALRMHAQTVIAWGDNTAGKATVPASASNAMAVAAGGTHSLALRNDGSVIAWGAINTVPPEATNITAIAAGQNHNLALRDDGMVIAWGSNNSFGQSVAPTAATNIAVIAAGAFHNVALRSNGTVLAWGRNDAGQTNVPPGLSNVIAVAAGTNQTLILQADGRLTVLGGTPGQSASLPLRQPVPVTGLAAGQSHNLFLLGDGTLRVAGVSPMPTNLFTNRFSVVAANGTANIALCGGTGGCLAGVRARPQISPPPRPTLSPFPPDQPTDWPFAGMALCDCLVRSPTEAPPAWVSRCRWRRAWWARSQSGFSGCVTASPCPATPTRRFPSQRTWGMR